MTKEEFLNRISYAEDWLADQTGNAYLCPALCGKGWEYCIASETILQVFSELFKPVYKHKMQNWWGKSDKVGALENRLNALYLFEQYCLDTKAYLKFGL